MLLVDVGTLEPPQIQPDISREEIAAAAQVDFATILARRDRGEAVASMARGAPIVLCRLQQETGTTPAQLQQCRNRCFAVIGDAEPYRHDGVLTRQLGGFGTIRDQP